MPLAVPPSDVDGAEVEFHVEDCFAVAVSERQGCRLELVTAQVRSDGRRMLVFEVRGADPPAVRTETERASTVDRSRTVRSPGSQALLQVVYAGSEVATTLADADAIVRRASADDGDGRLLALVPAGDSVRAVAEAVTDRHPTARVVACRRSSRRDFAADDPPASHLLDRLTERQHEAVRAAYDAGYYEWPREATAEECADRLGVSQPTFSEHLRVGERKLLGGVLGPAAAAGQS